MNRISAELSAQEKERISSLIDNIKTAMPFLIDLTKKERMNLPKLGNKNHPFVMKSLELAESNQDFLPRNFKVEEMRRDVDLHKALFNIHIELTMLTKKIEDSMIECGCEAYNAALTVYKNAKSNSVHGELETAINELSKCFVRSRKKHHDISKEPELSS